MKDKYLEMPSIRLMTDILSAVGRNQDRMRIERRLRSRIGLNDAQVAIVLDRDCEEPIKDADALRDKMITLQPNQPYRKTEADLRYIRQHMQSFLFLTVVFLFILATIVYIGAFDTTDRDPENIAMLRYVAPVLIIAAFARPFSLESPFVSLYFRMRKDLRTANRSVRTLDDIVRVLPFRAIDLGMVTIGVKIDVHEAGRLRRYYAIARDVWFDRPIDRDAFLGRSLRFTCLGSSRYVEEEDAGRLVRLAMNPKSKESSRKRK